jgi:hypothetical protein
VVDAVTEGGVTFPSQVLWNFRVASVGVQVVMWATIALAFGPLAERLLHGTRSAAQPATIGR